MGLLRDREAFIPYSRQDIIDICLSDGQLDNEEQQKFRNFCTLISAYYHFKFHSLLEKVKSNYAPFNPDLSTKSLQTICTDQKKVMQQQLVQTFQSILTKANYFPLPAEVLEKALNEQSLIQLHTEINFDDFEEVICYCQGDYFQDVTINKWFSQVLKEVDIYERVIILLKFKEQNQASKKSKPYLEKLEVSPELIYIYLYKNIPKYDLDFLFPNVQTSMTLADRLMFIIPAVGAAIPAILKIFPQLAFIIAVVAFAISGVELWDTLQITEEDLKNLMPITIAAFSLIITLGGFSFKQYTNYQNKLLKFQLNVSDTLFFRNLAINGGVLSSVVDAAEEEECKEIILVYYHLLTSKEALTPPKLDEKIETWMEGKLGTKIDFDIESTLEELTQIRGKVIHSGDNEEEVKEIPLLSYDHLGNCQIKTLNEALMVVDYLWDRAFLYSS